MHGMWGISWGVSWEGSGATMPASVRRSPFMLRENGRMKTNEDMVVTII
jgi:hypothetical protein